MLQNALLTRMDAYNGFDIVLLEQDDKAVYIVESVHAALPAFLGHYPSIFEARKAIRAWWSLTNKENK